MSTPLCLLGLILLLPLLVICAVLVGAAALAFILMDRIATRLPI